MVDEVEFIVPFLLLGGGLENVAPVLIGIDEKNDGGLQSRLGRLACAAAGMGPRSTIPSLSLQSPPNLNHFCLLLLPLESLPSGPIAISTLV